MSTRYLRRAVPRIANPASVALTMNTVAPGVGRRHAREKMPDDTSLSFRIGIRRSSWIWIHVALGFALELVKAHAATEGIRPALVFTPVLCGACVLVHVTYRILNGGFWNVVSHLAISAFMMLVVRPFPTGLFRRGDLSLTCPVLALDRIPPRERGSPPPVRWHG